MRLVRLARQQSRVADDVRAALASLGRGGTMIGGVALIGVGSVTERPIEAVVLLPHGVIIVIGVDLPDPALRLEAPLGGPWKADGWPLVADDDAVNPATDALDVSQACEQRITSLVPGTAPIGTIIAVGPYVETVDQPASDLAGPVRVLHPTPTTMLAATVSLATAHRPRSVEQVRALIRGLAPEAPELSDEVLLGEGFARFTDDAPPESLWEPAPVPVPRPAVVPRSGGFATARPVEADSGAAVEPPAGEVPSASAAPSGAASPGPEAEATRKLGSPPPAAGHDEPATEKSPADRELDSASPGPEAAFDAAEATRKLSPPPAAGHDEPVTEKSPADREPDSALTAPATKAPFGAAEATQKLSPPSLTAQPATAKSPAAEGEPDSAPKPPGTKALFGTAGPTPKLSSQPPAGPQGERATTESLAAEPETGAAAKAPVAAESSPAPESTTPIADDSDPAGPVDTTQPTRKLSSPPKPAAAAPLAEEAEPTEKLVPGPRPVQQPRFASDSAVTAELFPAPQPAAAPEPEPAPSVSRTARWVPLAAVGLLVAIVVAAVLFATGNNDTAAAPSAGSSSAAPPPPPTSSSKPAPSLRFTVRAAAGDQRCASHAFGDAQASLQQTSCSGVRRASYSAVVDGREGAVTIGVVAFPDAAQATAFKAVVDNPGGGGILDLATETGQWPGSPPKFENAAYASKIDGTSVRLVQAAWVPGPSTSDDPGLARAAKAALDLPTP